MSEEAQSAQPAVTQSKPANTAMSGPDAPAPDSKPAEVVPEAATKEEAGKPAKEPPDVTRDKPGDAGAAIKDAKKLKADEATAPAAQKDESGGASGTGEKHDASQEKKRVGEEQPVNQPVDADSSAMHEAAAPTGEDVAARSGDAIPGDDKSKARRKSSSGVPEHKGKKLSKKASKAKILHVDAKPGDQFFTKLKGFPPWPVIIADEDMLPNNMLSHRPVSAARPDGSYREDFADDGKRVADRTFPVMYLHTNEFSWTRNSDLDELDPQTVRDLITTKMRKDLQRAHELAAEQHSLDHYKGVLRDFEEARLAAIEKKAAKAKTPKKSKKADAPEADEDEDTEMFDVDQIDADEPKEKKKPSKKRKAEGEADTPQRSESVKKMKIKLTSSSTPKPANGIQSPKDSASKPARGNTRQKKETEGKKAEKESTPKEPELNPEEKRVRKEKEILFLRHRLQKGLLLRDQEPKEEEMKSMSEFLARLETFPNLEVSIIRATKINKVLKAILKLDTIPKEGEFKFKARSQTLLEKWNKLLASVETPTPANGVNGSAAGEGSASKETNGVKAEAEDVKEAPAAEKTKEDTKEEAEAEAEASKDETAVEANDED